MSSEASLAIHPAIHALLSFPPSAQSKRADDPCRWIRVLVRERAQRRQGRGRLYVLDEVSWRRGAELWRRIPNEL